MADCVINSDGIRVCTNVRSKTWIYTQADLIKNTTCQLYPASPNNQLPTWVCGCLIQLHHPFMPSTPHISILFNVQYACQMSYSSTSSWCMTTGFYASSPLPDIDNDHRHLYEINKYQYLYSDKNDFTFYQKIDAHDKYNAANPMGISYTGSSDPIVHGIGQFLGVTIKVSDED